MATVLRPENAGQVRDAVAWAVSEETPFEVIGGGSKRAIGRPGNASHTLDLSALRGITLYEPEELVLSAGPGTPMAEVNAALAESLYGPLDVVAGFVREDQVRHLAPGYRFDVLAAGVVWHYDHGPDVPMRLGVQSPASLQDVLRELSAKVAA